MSHIAQVDREDTSGKPDLTTRGLAVLLAGAFIAYLALMHPSAASPVLAGLTVITVLYLLMGGKR
ncbi:hypothetical protein [Micromonospora sp. NPDC049645]|uniref:hypothetical protein n=1 Tax=Micromonospora sp. NPDC049645 TaxID=3155508 RepID=UPI003432FA5C